MLSLLGMSEAEREGMDALCARGLSGDDAYQLACVTVARLGTGAFNAYGDVWKKLGQKLDFYLLSRDVPSIMQKHRHRERATVEVARYLDRFRPVQPGTKIEPPPPWVDTASPWGERPYGVETPRFSVDCRQAPRRKWRPRSEGSVLRFPHLWPVGAALAHPKRMMGPQFKGTVLMDASGSMHLEAEEIPEFARSFPGARLVIYFGGPDKTGREEVGRMFEVAAKGKAIAARDLDRVWNGRDNLIDGPALRWLGKQAGPPVWVSDGGVTGKGAWFDRNVIDGVVNGSAVVTRIASRINGAFDFKIIDGLVNLTADVIHGFGGGARRIQTGSINGYLYVVVVLVTAVLFARAW